MKLTILTPTFNRGGVLKNLYESLQLQTCKDFEWLIVDDGSNDNTKKFVSSWMENDNGFSISYLYKINGGKHTALNLGIRNIETDLTFIVDSDDTLSEDAVETILRYHRRYDDEENICGYAFLRRFYNGNINGKLFKTDEYIDSYIESRINSDDTFADKAEVYKTKCLKEYPFPEYTGEKFLGEDIVWMRMAKKYLMVHINKAIYIGQYQDDGLTKNRRIHNIKSPIGCMNRAKEFMCKDIKCKYRIKATLQYIVYGLFAEEKILSLIKNSPDRKMTIIFCIPGLIIYFKWKSDFKN